VRLQPNRFTPDLNDYVAEVDTAGITRRQSDIIECIASEGRAIKSETVRAVLDRANAVKQKFLPQGYSVFDDVIHLTPRVTGSWVGTEHFMEGHHRVTVDAVTSKALHEQFKQAGVEVLIHLTPRMTGSWVCTEHFMEGHHRMTVNAVTSKAQHEHFKQTGIEIPGVAESRSRIILVTDMATQQTDGAVTLGDDIVIAGNRIRLSGLPQPVGSFDPGINVFFVAADGLSVTPAVRMSENIPTRLIARVPPDLTANQNYRLRIATRYPDSLTLLREPRSIEYELPVNSLLIKNIRLNFHGKCSCVPTG
jgi:nitrogen fixation protein FixH